MITVTIRDNFDHGTELTGDLSKTGIEYTLTSDHPYSGLVAADMVTQAARLMDLAERAKDARLDEESEGDE